MKLDFLDLVRHHLTGSLWLREGETSYSRPFLCRTGGEVMAQVYSSVYGFVNLRSTTFRLGSAVSSSILVNSSSTSSATTTRLWGSLLGSKVPGKRVGGIPPILDGPASVAPFRESPDIWTHVK